MAVNDATKVKGDIAARVANARRFENILNIKELTPEQKERLRITIDKAEFNQILGEELAGESDVLWDAREDWYVYGADLGPEEAGTASEPIEKPQSQHNIRHQVHARELTYEEFKKQAEVEAQKQADAWEKNPDLIQGQTKDEVYKNAHNQIHDNFVRQNRETAQDWATKHDDLNLFAALERKKLEDERLAAKAAEQVKSPRAAKIKDISELSPVGKVKKAPDPFAGTRVLWQRPSPGQVVLEPRSPILRGARKTRRILSSALSFLLRFLNRVGIGAILTTLSSIVVGAISFLTTITTTVIATISTIVAFITAKAVALTAAVWVPILIFIALWALIAVVLISVLGFFFGGPAPGVPPTESPYPGITFSKVCPTDPVPINGNAICQIILFHDSSTATCPLGDITLVDALPEGTTLVEGPNLTTGSYTYNALSKEVRWKLSDNITQPVTDIAQGFSFKLTLTSPQNINVTNRLFLEGCIVP